MTHNYSSDELKEIAKDPRNKVYEVKYRHVDYTPMHNVKNLIRIVRGLSLALRREHADWTDDQIRDEISRRSQAAEKMRKDTHPKLFEKITDRKVTESDMETLAHMIALYERKEKGELSQEDVETAVYVKMLKDLKKK